MAGGSRSRPQRGNYHNRAVAVVIQLDLDLDTVIDGNEYSKREFNLVLAGRHRNLRRVYRRHALRADAGRDCRRKRQDH
jgi:hypothetical protein